MACQNGVFGMHTILLPLLCPIQYMAKKKFYLSASQLNLAPSGLIKADLHLPIGKVAR